MDKQRKQQRAIDIAMGLAWGDSNEGVCTSCLDTQTAEPDARNYQCEACETPTVQGWMVLIELA